MAPAVRALAFKWQRRGVTSTGPLFIACNGLLCQTCYAGIIADPATREAAVR